MAKTVFRSNEIKLKDSGKVTLKLIHDYSPKEEVVEKVEEYNGPTPDEIRKEVEAFKAGWEIEKQHMIDDAKKNAEEIVENAKKEASELSAKNSQEIEILSNNAKVDAEKIIQDAKDEADRIIKTAESQEEIIKNRSSQEGYDNGYKDGFKIGEDEQNRLVERIHKIIETIMTRRQEILKETEAQIVELVVLMTRKVVKVISENQKSVIANNILAALNKVKSRGEVILRVNMEDAKIATQNLMEFTKRVENVSKITIIEDSSIEKGGCIVETDFGEIDATIQSQLHEIESKIIESSPIKTVAKKSEKQ